jgi:diguanylate cyclase (GGDEF)-like protein
LPDPALEWLRTALGAVAVWSVEAERGDLPHEVTRRVGQQVPAEDDLFAAEMRLDRARIDGQPLVERLDAGVLVVRSGSGFAAAALLPQGTAGHVLARAEDELDRLLEGLKRRPRVTTLAPVDAQERQESVESVGQRLALELERLTAADVIVAIDLGDGLTVVGLGGNADPRLQGTIAPPESPLATMLRTGGSFEETEAPPLGAPVGERRRQLRPAVLAPIEAFGQRIGAVALWPSGRYNLPPQLQLRVKEVIRRAGPRAQRARELRGLEHEATRDRLTGLANRRALDAAIHLHGLTRAAFVLCDLDRFKALNDTLGHKAGDAALLHLAAVLRGQLRGRDLAARIGGEEFVLWLPETDFEDALAVAERVRDAVETSQWIWQGAPWLLTASFGVAHWPESSRHVDNLYAQADAALYDAKRGGRNRVVAASRAVVRR